MLINIFATPKKTATSAKPYSSGFERINLAAASQQKNSVDPDHASEDYSDA
jgi:hypothetical protein